MATKYTFQTIKDGVVPAQVSETINLDESNITTYENKLIADYDDLEKYAKKLKDEVADSSKSRKGLKGKVKTQLGKLSTFCTNQNKAAKDLEKSLKKAIKSDTKSLDNAIKASNKLKELDALLGDSTVKGSAALTAYFNSQRSELITSTAKTTGFTIGSGGTLSNKGTTFTVGTNGTLTKK